MYRKNISTNNKIFFKNIYLKTINISFNLLPGFLRPMKTKIVKMLMKPTSNNWQTVSRELGQQKLHS